LQQVVTADGTTYLVTRWNLSRSLPSLAAVAAFTERVAGASSEEKTHA
jgi:hypothetical protein